METEFMLEVLSRTLTEKIRRLYNSVGKRSANLWCSVQLRFFPVKEINYYHVSEVQVLEMRYNGYNDAWNSLKKRKEKQFWVQNGTFLYARKNETFSDMNPGPPYHFTSSTKIAQNSEKSYAQVASGQSYIKLPFWAIFFSFPGSSAIKTQLYL